jgi:hypothetical protein
MDTIFVSVSSYRDRLCGRTLSSIFSEAKYPERIFIGLCQQNKTDEDSECDDIDNEIIKKYKNNIRTIKIPYYDARGPCYARYLCSTLWKGEDYFLQADSHVLMAKNWDEKAINMINEIKATTDSKKVILSHYTDLYENHGKPNPNNIVPRNCTAFFTDRGLISFNGAENISIGKNEYHKSAFIAGGFLFTESSFLQDVPFDPELDYLFVMEEILLSIRAWTNGYDIYTPSENLMFHLYTRKDENKIWTDNKTYKDDDAVEKAKYIIGLENKIPEYLKESAKKYGIGNIRSLQEYYKFAGIDIKNKKINKNFCHPELNTVSSSSSYAKFELYFYIFTLSMLIVLVVYLILKFTRNMRLKAVLT